MINTVNIKQAQLRTGYFKTGSGPRNVFIMGSCRVVNYVNYFAAMPQFTVYTLDPFNWNWDVNDDRVDYIGALKQQETNQDLLDMFAGCEIFIHEWYENAGMFNIKEIYNFGLKPDIDICIPNFNDLFILFKDIITFDSDMRKLAAQDFNVLGRLSSSTEEAIMDVSRFNLSRFEIVCMLSDIPEMWDYFNTYWTSQRLFWSYNHTTKWFTLAVFDFINREWFNGTLNVDRNHVDIFANNYTHVSEYDFKNYGIQWDEPIKKLSL